MIATVKFAAALVFNNLSHKDGYDSFDADGDGRLSLQDLLDAVAQLALEITEEDSTNLFAYLDTDGAGFIKREAWLQALEGANAEEVLKSRGIDSAVVSGANAASLQERPDPAQNATAPLAAPFLK